jgi:hypothetical protein
VRGKWPGSDSRTSAGEEENCNLRVPQATSTIVCAVKHFFMALKVLVKKNETKLSPCVRLLLLPVRKVDSREIFLLFYVFCVVCSCCSCHASEWTKKRL